MLHWYDPMGKKIDDLFLCFDGIGFDRQKKHKAGQNVEKPCA